MEYGQLLVAGNVQSKGSLTDRVNRNPVFFKNQLSDLNPFKSPNENTNLFLSRANSLSRVNKNIHQQIIKTSLSQQLANQIAIKQHLKKFSKEQQIQGERKIVKYNRLLLENQCQKEKRFFENFKQQANQVVKLKQQKKQQQKYQEHLQKSQIDNMYRNSQEMIRKRILGIQHPQIPNKYQKNLQNSNRVSQQQQYSYQKQKHNPEVRIYPTKSHHKPSFEQAIKLRNRMKQTLLEQIRLNSEKKMNQKIERSRTKFIDEKYKLTDNTIINPIDLKIAKDNPYISKQSLRNRDLMMGVTQRRVGSKRAGNNELSAPSSYLSRRGSNSLSKLAY